MSDAVSTWQDAPMRNKRGDGSAGVAISLFSGAGGLDWGVEQAGYQVRVAVERYPDATVTMEKNFPHLAAPVIKSDILRFPTPAIFPAAGPTARPRPTSLPAGPPSP